MDLISVVKRIISESTLLHASDLEAEVPAFAAELKATLAADDCLRKAARAGHAQFGMLLTVLQEDVALLAAEAHEPEVDTELHAWIEALGAAIIASAEVQLTPFARDVAELWPTVPAEVQISLARAAVKDIMFSLSDPVISEGPDYEYDDEEDDESEGQTSEADPPAEAQRPAPRGLEWLADLERPYDIRTSQPVHFGNPKTGKVKPNCLGVGMIMAAFAMATGAPTMLGSRQRQMSAELGYFYARLGAELLELFPENVPSQLEKFFDDLQDRQQDMQRTAMRTEDFHASVVLQLDDGRWMHLDPYLDDFGLYGESWQLDQAFRLLGEYAPALPGLTATVTDEGAFDRFFATWEQRIATLEQLLGNFRGEDEALVASSPSVVAAADRLTTNFLFPSQFDAMDQVKLSELNLWLAELHLTVDGGYNLEDVDQLIVEHLYNNFDRQVLKNADKVQYIKIMHGLINSQSTQFNFDPDYRRDYYARHRGFCLKFFDELWVADWLKIADSYVFACPQLECSRPTYGLALSLLNQYICWTDCDLPATVLLGLGSSPMWWHEAMDLSQGKIPDSPQLTWVEAMIRELPLHHPRVQRKLALLDARRARLQEQ